MCGIVALLGDRRTDALAGRLAAHHRGPDASGIQSGDGVTLVHTRLAILDVDSRSDQPMRRGHVTVSYNGELWNYVALRRELLALGRTFDTTGDTEVVATALDQWGTAALPKFDGMFAIAWTTGDGRLHLTRDRFGEIPLHWSPTGAASEMRILSAAGLGRTAAWVPPGQVVTLAPGVLPKISWWHDNSLAAAETVVSLDDAAGDLRVLVSCGVTDRTIADVPVCTLLSGGLDSTTIAWVASRTMPNLVAYTAVMDPKSADLRAARIAAARIGIELREVPIPYPSPEDLAMTVRTIEMPHKAQVEIGWACLALARRIRADGFKVVFSGEGADELFGSYGFAYHGIKAEGWREYRRGAFLAQHRKNFARCNKAFMAVGVECRLPFLHPPLVDYVWNLPASAVRLPSKPKAVLEAAFADVLPPEIANRRKVAFQDGLGMKAAAEAVVFQPAAYYREQFDRRYVEAK